MTSSDDTTVQGAVHSWLGISYATADRFHSPKIVPFDPDLPYDQKGLAPLQAGDTSWLEADNGFSEDCLNLNVWAPADAGDKPLPVIVYVFGGGWMLGANTQTTSNASGLAATGRAIGVSINYRLGAFGALSLSQYGGALAQATNLCLQDIITALRWVNENISHFGGDPNNVTVTGHSAGAYSTLSLLGAPSADGLYHHLAAFSGMPARQVPAWGAEERAHAVLTALGIENDPEQLLTVDAHLLAETMAATQSSDPGAAHGVDNDLVAIVDDRTQPNGILTDLPMRVLESGRHKEIDILFSSTTHELDWWVLHKTDEFDPGSIDAFVTEFANRNRIPRSRARKIVAAYDVNGRTPVQVRGALLTDFSFTLPQTRGALAHAAAGGNAHLLSIGPVEGAHAVHGTEMYGIVGQTRPGAGHEQIVRDTFVRDALLSLATSDNGALWRPVATAPTAQGIGDMPYDATAHAEDVLETFSGIKRP
ncbi:MULTISPECIES: carboxylesterase family protein [unclassified Nocardioides]|uniref:carboxylesterase family protein n=1 Tax=unclassified Nocardioides TaxID=2615069 RepID=UPI00070380D9|nr:MULTISPECIES: carboxylesterase family protein [unclassified Nocardioides]KRC53121.1 carboxylesterase [Nocardioides sp. Root79]KRC72649.1 carboxylesterase [Nocardioides sp. Root240]